MPCHKKHRKNNNLLWWSEHQHYKLHKQTHTHIKTHTSGRVKIIFPFPFLYLKKKKWNISTHSLFTFLFSPSPLRKISEAKVTFPDFPLIPNPKYDHELKRI